MTLNISLVDGFRILSDKNNFILAREEGERMFHEGFFSNLDSLVKSFISRKIRGFDSTSLLALNNSIKALEIRFCNAIQSLNLPSDPKKCEKLKEAEK